MWNFEKIARSLIKAANQNLAARSELLRQLCPELVTQVEADCGPRGPLPFWGWCRNIDENAHQVIVNPSIQETIFFIAGQPFSPEHPHAGLQHTYGYLFSIIDTPYGRKRDRWVDTSLEAAFDLPSDVLSPSPNDGTLLANATWLAGSIAFRGHRRLKWMQRCLSKRAAASLRKLNPKDLKGLRFQESVFLRTSRGHRARVSFVTDLIRMPCVESLNHDAHWLLVYSVNDDRNRDPYLITLFTVTEEFVESICERSATAQRDDIRPRYNTYVPGFPREPQVGRVKITKS